MGQKNLYKDPCDEWLDLINMKLTSPYYPDPYDPLTDCKWNLTAPEGQYVTLDFNIIDVSKKESLIIIISKSSHFSNSCGSLMRLTIYQYKRLILMEINYW